MVFAPLNTFNSSNEFLLNIPRQCFFGGSFSLFMFHVCLYYTVFSVPCSIVITCWERSDLLVLLCVMEPCNLPSYHMVSRVRCGTWLYRFLIFAFLLSLNFEIMNDSCFHRNQYNM